MQTIIISLLIWPMFSAPLIWRKSKRVAIGSKKCRLQQMILTRDTRSTVRLKIPLGTVITIVGEPFHKYDKGDSDFIRVTSIAGKALRQPVVMPYKMWPSANVKSLKDNSMYNSASTKAEASLAFPIRQ